MSRIRIHALEPKSRINKNIYGHFSEHLGRCIYQGLFVGEDSTIPHVNGMRTDVVEALKQIQIPVLRWPGGCFADEYHWKDGIGPRESRKRMVNTHWGGVVEDNSFGTHEFMELCHQLGCEPYINGNVGSGTVQEMSEWMEYMTFGGISPMAKLREENDRKEPWQVTYFGVGNESWGCGGNMRPEYYGDLYRHFQTYVRNYGENKVFKIACGPSVDDYQWTDTLMEIAGKYTDAITLHYYTLPTGNWEDKGNATGFTQDAYFTTLKKAQYMEELIVKHLQIMDKHDPQHKVGLIVDEWGTWYNVEPGTNPGFLYQQNTMRDAMVAALTLHTFNSHSDRVVMANIAQTVNVLQAVVLTEGEKMVLTPTYHVFDLLKGHQNATALSHTLETDAIGLGENRMDRLSVSASQKEDGGITVTVANLSPEEDCPVALSLEGKAWQQASGRILQGEMGAYNDFQTPDTLSVQPFTALTRQEDQLAFTMPPCSVVELTLA